ncbi:MAG: peptidyl-prolyl cis-trans isomerase [Pseudonocardia sp.]|nr:peptidyl-prolyl cis-trans isomerase [Pseudonocardia sp.]
MEEVVAEPDDASPQPGRRITIGPVPLPTSTRGRVTGIAAVVAVLAAGVGGWWWYRDTHVPDGVAFRAYGQDVTINQLDDDARTETALYGLRPPTDGPALDQFRKDFAKAIAVSMIMDHEAADRNIVVAQRQASDVLARFITQSYGEGPAGHDLFVQDLANKGTSEPKVLDELKRQMTVRELAARVTTGVAVSDQDVRQAFDQRKAHLGAPERRDIANIVVSDKAAADDIVGQLRAGASFDLLARQRSVDGATKDRGGDLGPVSADQLDPSYAAAAFQAPMGAVFGPVQTQYGFNVGQVRSVEPPAPAVFDQVKEQLRQKLAEERAMAKWSAFLVDAIKRAHVLYADEYRPADPDAPPARQPAAQPPAQQVPANMPAGPPPAAPQPGR